MDVFDLRNRLTRDYGNYVGSFFNILDDRIRDTVDAEIERGLLWPEPLIQLNPSFEPGEWVDELVDTGVLHQECCRIFRKGKDESDGLGKRLRLHRHQAEAIKVARTGANYVLTTGTGSGKSLAYIIPIVDHVLRQGSGRGVQAIVVYPMNALANSQEGELEKFLGAKGRRAVTFARYTGQERDQQKQEIIKNPPDILLTNFVMLELLLTRPQERPLVQAAKGLRFLVLDELHTYRGRQGADVAMLVRRAREAFAAERMQCVGTSATLAGPGTCDEQRAEVARVATLLFGGPVQPENVIGETLQRTTPARSLDDPAYVEELRERVADEEFGTPTDHAAFIDDPLSIWIETTFGVRAEEGTGRLIRARPRAIGGDEGAARGLSELTGLLEDVCAAAIEKQLLASYRSEPNPETGFPVFAFRLHQFISRGDTVYASIQPGDVRHLTVHGQQFVPGSRNRILLPLVFCRECGQEYYTVAVRDDPETGGKAFGPREVSDRLSGDEDAGAAFLYVSDESPWPRDAEAVLGRVPDDWLEEHRGVMRVKRTRRNDLPRPIRLAPNGSESETGIDCHYIPAPFRFCLNCGVAYGGRQSSDFGKLGSLATEGRSTATTILSLAAIRFLRAEEDLPAHARKLLSFTDNRQDASLQAGHFNDFIEIGLMRSALCKAVRDAGPEGVRHDELVQKVFTALSLPFDLYASDPEVRYQAREETDRALRSVLGYRLYRDLQRGWRITSPNLEQCGLLEIRYLSLDQICREEEMWRECHPALTNAAPETRQQVCQTLLDFMRRGLAVKVDYLDPLAQERIQQQSSQRLKEPWAIDENERDRMERSAVLYPRPRRPRDSGHNIFLSPRGGFGQFLRRRSTLPDHPGRLSLDDAARLSRHLLEVLRLGGLVEVVHEATAKAEVPGYQVPASAMLWLAGDGTTAFHDPIRVPRASAAGGRTNPFFVDFYRAIAGEGVGLEAREHTAQVKYELRVEREKRFRDGTLPILYCSPTMELGVDIAELNVVNLRNIPPTPANYAQRSGRAGRSGQPALVFSYCSTFSSHDQYFFRRPDLMVAGAVSPPRLDLANEDLIRAHLQAIWLAQTGMSLGKSLKDVLDLSGDDPSLGLLESTAADVENPAHRDRALARCRLVLASIEEELESADWYTRDWPEAVLAQVGLEFDRACERWRGLYSAAMRQRALQNRIIGDASRGQQEKGAAKRLRYEAESQLDLLTAGESSIQSDFYSYRYFASEGFLPGYSFPRLPLSAYVPGRRGGRGRNEFLSRPRFLAISEFGPRAIVYHEGSRYRINKVILPVDERGEGVPTTAVKQCGSCGYLHPVAEEPGPDVCECCGQELGSALRSLFRLQNVSTRRTDKINSDEEERLRLGYEIQSGVRFAEHDGRRSCRLARVRSNGSVLAELTYGPTATLWRINLGWRRRANREQRGFVLDIERGYWARNNQDAEDPDDPLSARTQRVIPYVEDRRNSLIFEPGERLAPGLMASLQAALKNAIQLEYQLEEFELVAEPLPGRDDRRLLLIYEAAEGGAGVLRHLVDDPAALGRAARVALELCHFDPDTGEDRRRAPGAREDCEAACYDCLMSYSNQQDHEILDRKEIRDLLVRLRDARVEPSPASVPRSEHLAGLLRQCQSGLERDWLRHLEERQLCLPSRAQALVPACKTRPDFLYEDHQAAIYVDGPHHDFPERRERDRTQTDCMEDLGYLVIRFGLRDDWDAIIARYPNIFGVSS